MASANFICVLILVMVGIWVALATEANSRLTRPATNITPSIRESKRKVFLIPNQKAVKELAMLDLESANNYKLDARRRSFPQSPYSSAGQQPSVDERLFGLTNLFLAQFPCPVCPSCPNCPTCAECQTCSLCPLCPTACTETSVALSNPITITVPATSSCTVNVLASATGFGPCTAVTARPSGTFSVVFQAQGNTAAPWSTAFIGILATCPNTKVTVTCGALLANYIVTTQSGASLTGASTGGTLIEAGFMQLMVSQQGSTAAVATTIQCSWTSSP